MAKEFLRCRSSYIKVEVVSNLENNDTGQEFEVVGINSYLSGFSIMMTWEGNAALTASTMDKKLVKKLVKQTVKKIGGRVLGGIGLALLIIDFTYCMLAQ